MEHSKVFSAIRSAYPKLTAAEQTAADFFLHNREKGDFSSKVVAARLYVSEASLSRFAQKCGYKGYREFIYEYQRMFQQGNRFLSFSQVTQEVLAHYQDMLDTSSTLVDEGQMRRVSQLLANSSRVYVYGMGSSGFAARELALRLMRTGMLVEAITESHMIRMNAVLADEKATIVAITLSGTTQEVLWGAKEARRRGAKVVLMTSSQDPEVLSLGDETLRMASGEMLSAGFRISPQFPVLVMADLFFAYLMGSDEFVNRERYWRTMEVVMGEGYQGTFPFSWDETDQPDEKGDSEDDS